MRLIALLLLLLPAGQVYGQGMTSNPDDFGRASVFENPAPLPAGTGSIDAPPALKACISRSERNAALRSAGCDCSCGGYAAAMSGPWDRTCDMVCGVEWYACWNPIPDKDAVRTRYLANFTHYSPQDFARIEESLMDMLADPEAVREIGKGQVAEDALAWDTTRSCK